MGKLCQCCNQREAKIHFTELKDGKKTEMHLCEVCAQEKNMVLAFPSLLSTLVKGGSESAAAEAEAVSSVCPRCGLAYSEFKAKGRIGCPACYDAFAAVLIPLLTKVHNASTHTGKRPPHEAGPDLEPPSTPDAASETAPEPAPSAKSAEVAEVDEVALLREQLTAAVAAEDYERCAELRDRIRSLQAPQASAPDESAQEDFGEV